MAYPIWKSMYSEPYIEISIAYPRNPVFNKMSTETTNINVAYRPIVVIRM